MRQKSVQIRVDEKFKKLIQDTQLAIIKQEKGVISFRKTTEELAKSFKVNDFIENINKNTKKD